jgi:oligoribonuclease NrnB/cAMP/cGMP phosphodiesterase (DHH superfamily)
MGNNTITKDIVVFYHGQCRDGFTAAWAAWKKFGDMADYLPVIWSNLLLDQIPSVAGKEIYFLDYAPGEEDFQRVVKEAKSVVIIDHHVSKEEMVKSLPGSIYDANHSGGVLAWKYFHPDMKVPHLCLYVEDSDIWKWNIPSSGNILAYMDLMREFNFESWDSIATDLEDESKRKEYIDKGELILASCRRMTDDIMREHMQLVDFQGYQIYAVNAPRIFKSDIGNRLAKLKPPFAIVWSQTPDEISVSLRSVGGFDTIPIASKFGGGGHKAASNFRLPLDSSLPWKVIK